MNVGTTGNAELILKHAKKSVGALQKAFQIVREKRGAERGMTGAERGMTTDEEQDLLRAMIVMAAAGLDAMVKRLIRDTLPVLVKIDDTVQEGLEVFLVRRIRGEAEAPGGVSGSKFLARILAATSHHDRLTEEYIQDLTGSSLQSGEELIRAAKALGLDPQHLNLKPAELKPIFEIRNKIIHELDIDLDATRRKRNLRAMDIMNSHADTLLAVGERFLKGVREKLAKTSA